MYGQHNFTLHKRSPELLPPSFRVDYDAVERRRQIVADAQERARAARANNAMPSPAAFRSLLKMLAVAKDKGNLPLVMFAMPNIVDYEGVKEIMRAEEQRLIEKIFGKPPRTVTREEFLADECPKTDWYPGTTPPARPGVYELHGYNKGNSFAYWDGGVWYITCGGSNPIKLALDAARERHRDPKKCEPHKRTNEFYQWRGFTEKQS